LTADGPRRKANHRISNATSWEGTLAKIPKTLQPHLNAAFPANTCQVATVLPNGYAQVTMRGSVLVFDDEHMAFWERGKGTTDENLKDGTKVTIFFRDPKLRESGMLPAGGIVRIYGTAKLAKDNPLKDQIWDKVVQPEKDRDAEKKGFGVLVTVDRIEDLTGKALTMP
jgi:hypothetical protein